MPVLGHVDHNAEARDSARFDPLPDGWYVAQLIEADVVTIKSGKGTRMPYTVEIIDGPLQKRRVWSGINILHESAQAQSIGQSQLRELSDACGHTWPIPPDANSDIFLFKPLMVRVGRQKDDREKNEVKAFKSLQAAAAASVAPSPPSPSSQQPGGYKPPAPGGYAQASSGGGGSRPWNR